MLRWSESSFSMTDNENVGLCFLFFQKMCWRLDGTVSRNIGYCMWWFWEEATLFYFCFFALASALDTPWIRTGPVGFQEVEIPPVHFTEGPALGKCSVSEGSQCHQCRVKEEGRDMQSHFWVFWPMSFDGLILLQKLWVTVVLQMVAY